MLSDETGQYTDAINRLLRRFLANGRYNDPVESQEEDKLRYLIAIMMLYTCGRSVERRGLYPHVHDPLPTMNFCETISLFYLADKAGLEDLYNDLLEYIDGWFWQAPYIHYCEFNWIFSSGLAVAETLRTRTNLTIPTAIAAYVVRKWRLGEPIQDVERLMEVAGSNVDFLEALHEAWQFHTDLRLR